MSSNAQTRRRALRLARSRGSPPGVSFAPPPRRERKLPPCLSRQRTSAATSSTSGGTRSGTSRSRSRGAGNRGSGASAMPCPAPAEQRVPCSAWMLFRRFVLWPTRLHQGRVAARKAALCCHATGGRWNRSHDETHAQAQREVARAPPPQPSARRRSVMRRSTPGASTELAPACGSLCQRRPVLCSTTDASLGYAASVFAIPSRAGG
jgi:hypothetical protein